MRRLWDEIRPSLPTAMLLLAPWIGWTAVLCWALMVFATFRIARERDGRILFLRWYLLRLPGFRIFLHELTSHDLNPNPHNHPWHWCRSLILAGGYVEFRHDDTGGAFHWYSRGEWNQISDTTFHRIDDVRSNTWTLFIAGRRNKEWGFMTPRGFRHHTEEGRE